MMDRGVAVSTPNAHVAQCTLDRDALLLSRDIVFAQIADVVPYAYGRPELTAHVGLWIH